MLQKADNLSKEKEPFFSGWTFVFVGDDDDSLMQFEYWWFQSVGLINLFHTHAVESKESLHLQSSKNPTIRLKFQNHSKTGGSDL
jgi:hypothetical protein